MALLAEDDEEEEEKEDDDDDQRIFYLLRLFILRSDGVRANNLDQLNGTFLPSRLRVYLGKTFVLPCWRYSEMIP